MSDRSFDRFFILRSHHLQSILARPILTSLRSSFRVPLCRCPLVIVRLPCLFSKFAVTQAKRAAAGTRSKEMGNEFGDSKLENTIHQDDYRLWMLRQGNREAIIDVVQDCWPLFFERLLPDETVPSSVSRTASSITCKYKTKDDFETGFCCIECRSMPSTPETGTFTITR